MKCLLTHKMYYLEQAIKLAILSSFGSFFVLSFLAHKITILSDFVYFVDFVIAASCASFCTINIQTKQKDEECQWEKFCFTLPVTRTQVVQSEFISQWFITFTTMILASFFIIILNLTGLPINFYQVTEVFTLLFVVNVISQSVLYVAGIKLGYGNIDSLNMIATGASVAIYLIPSFFIELALPNDLLNLPYLDYIYRVVICIIAIVVSCICYVLSLNLVEKQEI